MDDINADIDEVNDKEIPQGKPPQGDAKDHQKSENINTDDKEPYDWKSKYPTEARKEIRNEAIYIGAVLIVAMIGLFLNGCDVLSNLLALKDDAIITFKGILFYFLSGLLGGTIFGIKYFYRVVARGYWTQDRRYWRIFSPWISACVAFIIGCMVISGLISSSKTLSASSGIYIGFIAGYFADEAVGKMSEVATALFGNVTKK